MANRISRDKFIQLIYDLWDVGEKETNAKHPDLSISDLKRANDYFNTFRCPDCWCGACVPINELADNIDNAPNELKALANWALKG